jgi:hypothetical protein
MNTAPTSPMTSVFAGQRFVGFLFHRGNQVEAFDENHSLGLFENQEKAIAAIAAHSNESRAALARGPGKRKSVHDSTSVSADSPQAK